MTLTDAVLRNCVSSWLDYTINGLIIGNIYALLAVGLALIFGVSRLINFAHGSVYIVGAYVGWSWRSRICGTPLPVTIVIVRGRSARCSAWSIERFGLRPLQGYGAHRAAAGDHRHQLRARPAGAAHLLARSARAAELSCPMCASRSAAARSARSTC